MAFLFKSKNKQGLPPATRGLTSADDSSATGLNGISPSEKELRARTGPTPPPGSASALAARAATPDQFNLQQSEKQAAKTTGSPSQRPPVDVSLYPWSQRRLDFVNPQQNPFPRYGAATNAVASPKGDLYLMGGLINGATVKGDLWLIEAGSGAMTCSSVATMAEGPGPRVGHASLLVGNAFIVFGGDTKVEETDTLDDTLYLLNTSSKQWSRALPGGPRPPGRYGHTLNILGSKIYIFGGQVEGFFFNDLVAFDLNALQAATHRWEFLIQNTSNGGPPAGQSPPPRTNHTVVTWDDKLYLFGGTDGITWFNDVWAYDPRTNSWTPQECIGFIPTAREGHAAALVNDVMYVFGGRTEEGKDLGDLAAFRIPTKRWYTFQNMGPSPSPRSGHGMTAFGDRILVAGGEPSSAPRDAAELSLAYVLDTSKIRYPNDQPSQSPANGRLPSVMNAAPRQESVSRERSGSGAGAFINGRGGSTDQINANDTVAQRAPDLSPAVGASAGQFGRLPRTSPAPPPQNPPPGPPAQMRMNGAMRPFTQGDGRDSPRLNSRAERPIATENVDPHGLDSSPPATTKDVPMSDSGYSTPSIPGQFPTMRSPSDSESFSAPTGSMGNQPGYTRAAAFANKQPQQPVLKKFGSREEMARNPAATIDNHYAAPEDLDRRVAPNSVLESANSSGASPALSQHNEELRNELESLKSKNAWYASELALAQQAGYRVEEPNSSIEDIANSSLSETERTLMEALLRMKNELASVQGSLAAQNEKAAEKIAFAERQRDAAVAEAVYAKTRSAARPGDLSKKMMGGSEQMRIDENNRRLAVALRSQSELQSKVRALNEELENERKARQLAEESADVAHSRASELDSHHEESASEVERLRRELHDAQKSSGDHALNLTQLQNSHTLLQIEKEELNDRLVTSEGASKNHTTILTTLREAITSSTQKSEMLEQKLEQDRMQRSAVEEKLRQLRSEHDRTVAELEATNQRMQDAEDLSARHAAEARSHRDAVLAGFGRIANPDTDRSAQDERVNALRRQLENSDAICKRHQENIDAGGTKLRRAEERIAALEAYQEQLNRESLAMKKQLQDSSRDHVTLQSEKAQLQQLLSSEKMDHTALQVQHSTLREIVSDHGVDPNVVRNQSVLNSGPNSDRLKEIEQQLDASNRAREEMRATFERREQEANKGWEEKLEALDGDYQAAVKYLKGTDNLLGKMKKELHRYKSQNRELEEELARERTGQSKSKSQTGSPSPAENWEQERSTLQKEIEDMQERVNSAESQLSTHMDELKAATAARDQAHQELAASNQRSQSDFDALRSKNEELEARAAEAENQIQMLLESVGNTVSNYRESQQVAALRPNGSAHARVPSAETGHSRTVSTNSAGADSTSTYGASGDMDALVSRNSVALDNLTNELETLRSHWQSTTKNYRSSGQSMSDKTPTVASDSENAESLSDGLANWRKRMEAKSSEEQKE